MPVQVAAVCYRRNECSFEFLLVKTSAGKWTFPKGQLIPKMSASESASREALEEAGATGQIADKHFSSYIDTKRAFGHGRGAREIRIVTYLLKVQATITPEEDGRKPTWFAPHDARRRLSKGRDPDYAKQIARIVDSALKCLTKPRRRRSPILMRAQRRRFAPV